MSEAELEAAKIVISVLRALSGEAQDRVIERALSYMRKQRARDSV